MRALHLIEVVHFQFSLTLKKHATLFLTGILSRLIPNLDSLDVCEEYLRVLGKKHRYYEAQLKV